LEKGARRFVERVFKRDCEESIDRRTGQGSGKTANQSIKKSISSLSFSLNRLYRTISNAKPSGMILPLIMIAATLFLLGGGVYDIVVRPLPSVYYQGRFIFIYPQLTEQFISDSIVAMTIYALGAAGLLVIYQSTKSVYKPRQAYMMLMIGIMLFLLAYIVLEAVIHYLKGV
jgi:hypothetical protein